MLQKQLYNIYGMSDAILVMSTEKETHNYLGIICFVE